MGTSSCFGWPDRIRFVIGDIFLVAGIELNHEMAGAAREK
jgi:hypothetical protein